MTHGSCRRSLKGFPEAIEAVFPKTTVQTCIVHLIRSSLKYVPRREFADVTRDLKPIYTATDADAAHQALEAFDEKWGARFPVITQAWLEHWEYVTPFLAFPPEVRRVIYTTDENVKRRGGSGRAFSGRCVGRVGLFGGPRIASCGLDLARVVLERGVLGVRDRRRAATSFASGVLIGVRLR